MRHIIAILLQNEAGALSRVAGLFSTRGYNIESLSVAPTHDPTVSRLTLVTTGNDSVIAQILSQLRKLVDVVHVDDMTRGDHFERELLLLKLRVPESQLPALRSLVDASGGRILSGAPAKFVVELTSSEAQVSRFVAQAAQHGEVLEVVRSGALGIDQGAPALKAVPDATGTGG
jgi:acetolactate synthase-1/3 small subunit